ncbi:MAG: protein kinase [Verrucomicrobiales bacterium]|nr:protein kinase [Verrucomicrobiales bacterium]
MSDSSSRSEETIFSTALRRGPDERAAYLDEACAGQPELRRRVDELLRLQTQLGEFMENAQDSPGPFDPGAPAVLPEEHPTNRIGRYKLHQKIGEGGCGVVYMAEQEEPVRRRVALKVIKMGMDTRSVIARFEAERQALALMDHPNIAKVLDAGATENGRPYFVMELVRGVRITQFCDQNRLSTRERLDLFIQVCQAVQHAHHKGIIHRDLKPSNILVTVRDPGAPGVPVIIDFGIAKATQGRLTDQTLFTAFEQFMGTPAYMSPEQAMMTALDIDTRSDIYSMGVLLYELLTGRTPFDAKDLLASGIEAMRRTIREKEPQRPSTRLSTLLAVEQSAIASFRQTEPPKLVHLVRGDLDWIVMKCLEKDRARRYATANALAMDLQRHLDDEPVLARPPSRMYELRKTVRRHQVGFAAAGAVMLALAAGVWLSSREAARARRAEWQTRRTAYVADMDLANRALEEGDFGTAQTLLRRYRPGPGEPDLRNWEWRYLAQLSQGDPHFSLESHTSQVLGLRFLDDATLMSAGKADWRTVLWNVEERRPTLVITNGGPGGGVSGVLAMIPARNLMVYRAAWSKAVRISVIDLKRGVDLDTGLKEGLDLNVGAPIFSLDVSRDQRLLAVAFGKQVGLWDLDQRSWRTSFETESGEAVQGLFSPDGRVLAVADNSGRIVLWDYVEQRRLGMLMRPPRPDDYSDLRFSSDGQWLVNPGGRSSTQVWSVQDQSLVAELAEPVRTEYAAFSHDGRWLAVAGGDATIRLWETSDWKKVRTLRGHTDPVESLDFHPAGRFLASGARNGEVKLWSLEEPPHPTDQVSLSASFYSDVARDGSAFCRILKSEGSHEPATWVAEYWTTRPLQRVFSVPLTAGPPRVGCVLGRQQGVVLGGIDGSLRVLRPPDGQGRLATNAHSGEVYLMDASLDGSTLATKGNGKYGPEDRICIWRLPDLGLMAELKHAQSVHGIGLSDDGTRLAGFTGPGDMGVWNIPSMEGPPMWPGIPALSRVEVCAFSPDNRWLAAALPQGGAFLWDLTTRRRVVLQRALTFYNSLSFSPDGTRLAAGSESSSMLFDVPSGQGVLTFPERGTRMAFLHEGQRLLVQHSTGARMLRAPPVEDLQFDWLKVQSSDAPPPFRGPNPDYVRPDRPPTAQLIR